MGTYGLYGAEADLRHQAGLSGHAPKARRWWRGMGPLRGAVPARFSRSLQGSGSMRLGRVKVRRCYADVDPGDSTDPGE